MLFAKANTKINETRLGPQLSRYVTNQFLSPSCVFNLPGIMAVFYLILGVSSLFLNICYKVNN